jgi:ABC-2 type transport system permease protein
VDQAPHPALGALDPAVLFAVLGVLVMTSEYSSGTIRATLAAIPRRPLVLAAKAAVWGTTALVAGELVTFACFLAGAAFVHGAVPRPALSQPVVLRAVVLSGAYLCLVGLIGLAAGVIVRHGAALLAIGGWLLTRRDA